MVYEAPENYPLLYFNENSISSNFALTLQKNVG